MAISTCGSCKSDIEWKVGRAPSTCQTCLDSGVKFCNSCKGTKSHAEFYRHPSRGVNGMSSFCRPCTTKSSARGRRARIDSGLAWSPAKQHGLTDDEYRALMAAPVCHACGTGDAPGWHLDHDHGHCPGGTGCRECLRGLLCMQCNMALGLMQDDPELLLALAGYVARNPRLLSLSLSGQQRP